MTPERGATRGWDDVWARRSVAGDARSTLSGLLAADGFDTGFGSLSEASWRAGARHLERELGLSPGDSLFEVGCGAGALLYDFFERGYRVGGLDRSASLVGEAAAAMPGGSFSVADASALELGEEADAVVSFGVFLYFRSLEYARDVLARMVRASRRAVAVLDLPDAACRREALAARVELSGGEQAYEARYAGLQHLFFERGWFVDAMRESGLARVQVASQWLDDYPNGAYRFNAWGFKEPRSATAVRPVPAGRATPITRPSGRPAPPEPTEPAQG